MSEKRFTHINVLGNPTIWDKKNDKRYIQYDEETTDEICDLLNMQQDTISALEKENEQLKEENIKLKNLRKYCAEWIGVNEENLYDVVR